MCDDIAMATGTSVAEVDSISKHLTCSICWEVFKIPKTLSCLHTFCESCLDKHICKTGVSVPRNCFECPLCRAKISPNERLPKEQWAKSFPTNHMVISLLEDESLRSQAKFQSKPETILNCKPCDIEEKQNTAFCFCVNCKEYMCKKCYEEHRKFKSTRKHAILLGEDLPKDAVGFEKATELTHCNIHKGEKIEYKCKTHYAFLCSICATSSHQKCDAIEYIGNKAQHKKSFALDIPLLQQDVQKQIETNLRAVETIGRFASDVGHHIEDVKKETELLINLLENSLEHQFKAFVENKKQTLTKALQALFIVNEKLTQVRHVVEVTEKHGSEIPTVLLEDWIEGVRNEAKQMEQADSDHSLSMQEESICHEAKVLQSYIQDQILVKLSAISTPRHFPNCQNNVVSPVGKQSEMHSPETKMKYGRPYDKVFEDDANEPDSKNIERIDLDRVSLMDCDIRQVGQYDLSVSSHVSNSCCHNGSLLLPDGHMIFIDKENQLVKVVTAEFHVKCYKTLADAPLDVCLLKNGTIAVATTSSVTILDTKSKLETPVLQSKLHTVRSLCLLKDEAWMLCADTVNPDQDTAFSVIIADNKLRTIDRREKFTSWNGLDTTLKKAKQIRCRKAHEFIICRPKVINSFKLCGSERWFFRPNGLQNAEYVAFDMQNNLYVADIDSGAIFQMSHDCYRNYRTLIRGLPRPASILFNHLKQTLIIGCSQEDVVYEYKFTMT